MKIGDSGQQVRDLQQQLIALGADIKIDGDYGAATAAAVSSFQRDHGLTPDGIAGPLTLAALRATEHADVPAEAFEFHTAGPHPEHVDADEPVLDGAHYRRATFIAAHPGRVGGPITAWSKVVHTTDMPPRMFHGLVSTWAKDAGRRAAAHFIIGRDAAQGVVQMVPIDRNANHAGGTLPDGTPSHGNYVNTRGRRIHPNTVAIGIELHAGGRLGKRHADGTWVHPDSKELVPDEDVFVDAKGVGWHKITDYQFAELDLLLNALEDVLPPVPAGTTIEPNGTYAENGVPWAAFDNAREVVHATLDPRNKTDAGPQVVAWMKARTARLLTVDAEHH